MKKIAILSFYSGHIERGVETWVRGLQENIDSHKIKVFRSGSSTKINWQHESEKDTFLRKIFLDYWSLQILIFTVKSIPEIYKFNPDIILPTNGGWQSLVIRIYTWLTNKKMIIAGQSGIGWDDYINIYTFPNIFVAISTKARQWSRKSNRLIKTTYIPNAVDLNKFKKGGEKVKLNLQKPIIISVGAIETGKRHELAIQAVAKLGKGSLLILGDGDNKAEINSLGNDLLGEKRFLLKKVSFDEIPAYYRSVDLFTLASIDREAFGIVFIEAMACGLPIVANNDEIRKEIVGNAGILVDVTNIKAYSKAMTSALNKKWENNPRDQAEKFSWKLVSKKYTDLFNKL